MSACAQSFDQQVLAVSLLGETANQILFVACHSAVNYSPDPKRRREAGGQGLRIVFLTQYETVGYPLLAFSAATLRPLGKHMERYVALQPGPAPG